MNEDTNKRVQILEAAYHEFAAKGFRGATIKSIATAAGLQAPTLIYWYFPNKTALFEAVIHERFTWLQFTLDPHVVVELPPENILTRLAQSYISTFNSAETRQMAQFFLREIAQQNHHVQQILNQALPQVLNFLETYLRHQIKRQRLAEHDVAISARSFMGSLIPQALGKVIIDLPHPPTDEAYIEQVVTSFIRGLKGTTYEGN